MTWKDLLAPGMGLWLASVPFLTHIQGTTPDINFCHISQYVTVRHLLWRIINFLYISMRTSQEVFNSESGITYRLEGMKLLGSSNWMALKCFSFGFISSTSCWFLENLKLMFGILSSKNCSWHWSCSLVFEIPIWLSEGGISLLKEGYQLFWRLCCQYKNH